MKISKITKLAGAGLLGFCAVSLAADRLPLNPVASQVAGFAGAFLGSLVAKVRSGSGQPIGSKNGKSLISQSLEVTKKNVK